MSADAFEDEARLVQPEIQGWIASQELEILKDGVFERSIMRLVMLLGNELCVQGRK